MDCQWDEWISWSRCSKPCGGGEQKRSRTIKVHPINEGKKCRKKNSKEKQICHNWFCPGMNVLEFQNIVFGFSTNFLKL